MNEVTKYCLLLELKSEWYATVLNVILYSPPFLVVLVLNWTVLKNCWCLAFENISNVLHIGKIFKIGLESLKSLKKIQIIFPKAFTFLAQKC